MSLSLGWTCDDAGTRSLVTVGGRLDRATAANLRSGLLMALAEQPPGLLVDISAMTVSDRLALSIFPAVLRQAARWPGIPVLLCAPSPDVAAMLARTAHGRLDVVPTVEAGVTALNGSNTGLRSITDELLPVSGAARHARSVATEVCARWDQPDLTFAASLIASEFVGNAIEHAGTMITLQFTLRSRCLHVAARDGSTDMPRIRTPKTRNALRGRGLLLVKTLAAHWGSLPTDGGKVVWATLAARPLE